MTYDIPYSFYGANLEAFKHKESEYVLVGPAETGKTLALLTKLHLCAYKYPKAQIVILRKTLTSTYNTVLQMFQEKILGDAPGVKPYGGNKPQWFDYPNGARIWIAGLDKSSRILSAEHDLAYVNQCEELSLDDWEVLTTRTTGRAGHMPYSQTIGDANPTYPSHWMYNRDGLRLFYSRHEDNPALYDPTTGKLTTQGDRTMAVLKRLTGLRRKRLYLGQAAMAEGVIYEEWNEADHLIYEDDLPLLTRFVAGQDWGFVHPGVFGVWGMDNDGRMYLVAQIYQTKKTVDWWIEKAKELCERYPIEAIACDPSQPAYIEQYRQAGLPARKANNDVLFGIDSVQQRLQKAEDDKPRLFVVRDSVLYEDELLKEARHPWAVEQEFPGYVWADKKNKDVPVKELDDGMDFTRYSVLYVDAIRDIPQDVQQGLFESSPSRWTHERRSGSRWRGRG